jgi:predicted DNA-binding transcriptional regulator YafY
MDETTSTNRRQKVYLQAFARISKIHNEIVSEAFPSVRELAEKIGVTERTIKRDLDVMRIELNAPIIYERRKKGFRYSEIGWHLPQLSNFDEKHLLAVFIAENALKLTGHLPEAEDLRKALAKLVSQLPEKISFDLANLSDNLSFQSPAYELSDPELRQKLSIAATEQTTIEFDYYVQYRQTSERRKVDVYHLHNLGGDWYAISYDHARKELRDFHVGRISNLKMTNDGFEVRKRIWNKEEYLSGHFNMLRGGRQTKVKILFDAYQAQWIRVRQPFQQNEKKEDLPDGSLRLSFEIGEKALEAVARFCLQYAGHCIAEKPKKLREIIKEKLEKAITLHQ